MGCIRYAGGVLAGLLVVAFSGCNYTPPGRTITTTGNFTPGVLPTSKSKGGAGSPSVTTKRDEAERAAILESSIKLIQGAALKPGGDNFRLATQKLNQYFEGTARASYQLDPEVLEFLGGILPPEMIQSLQHARWAEGRDARHLEDCMMYYNIANRIGGSSTGSSRRSSSSLSAAWARERPRRSTPGPTTCCCEGWGPSRKVSGPSAPGRSWRSAANSTWTSGS